MVTSFFHRCGYVAGGTMRLPLWVDCHSCRRSVRLTQELPKWKYFLSARTAQHSGSRSAFSWALVAVAGGNYPVMNLD
jgi:hypothetical protein